MCTYPGLKKVEVRNKFTCRESALALVVTLQLVLIKCVWSNETVFLIEK